MHAQLLSWPRRLTGLRLGRVVRWFRASGGSLVPVLLLLRNKNLPGLSSISIGGARVRARSFRLIWWHVCTWRSQHLLPRFCVHGCLRSARRGVVGGCHRDAWPVSSPDRRHLVDPEPDERYVPACTQLRYGWYERSCRTAWLTLTCLSCFSHLVFFRLCCGDANISDFI